MQGDIHMNRKTIAKPLDIWDAISKRFQSFLEDKAIEECRICLDIRNEEDCYVEIAYYDLLNPEMDYNEEPEIKRFSLNAEEAEEMYRDISEVVELPRSVYKLYAHLNSQYVPVFQIEMVPILRER
jgi:hypothetical protein